MVNPSESLARLEALSQRRTTTMGNAAGEMVWHVWGERRVGSPPLVLFHGGSGSWTHWIRNLDALLHDGRQIWVPDLPGFGDSDLPPDGMDADAMVEPLRAGLRELLGDEPCDLVGFSFGGMTAGLLAAEFPEVVLRLVLVGAPAMGVVPERQFQLKGWRHLPTLPEQMSAHRHNLEALMFSDAIHIDDETLFLHMRNVERDRLPRRRLARTDILVRSLPRVRCPVHAIYGALDSFYKQWIAELEGAFRSVGPHFQGLELIPESGHWVQYEQPQAFHRALYKALA